MPANLDPLYAQWLTQHGQVDVPAVNVLEFAHPAFGSIYVSDYGDPFSVRLETALDVTAQALGFTIDATVDNLTTEQRVTIRTDAANGAVMNQFRALSLDDFQEPIVVTHRVYLDTKRNAPVIDPLVLYVTRVNAGRLAVEMEASTEAFPNVTAGIRYTFERFPSLAYL